jgi:uncharacterized membrane protein (DUF4010 family)
MFTPLPMTEGLFNLLIALGLGLLVGLQRERAAAAALAGFRTFALTTLLGALCGHLGGRLESGLVVSGLAAIAALLVAANWIGAKRPGYDPGLTTEVALLVMFLVGVLAGLGQRGLAVVVGATTAVLLHLRPQLHSLARGLGEHDMRAIMQFVAIALVVLPVLPDRTFGPFAVLNPHRMWWMVVLITGISLASYVAFKVLGPRGGNLAAGLLGGLISSTATTVTAAKQSRINPAGSGSATLVIQLASAVVFGRVLVLIGSVAPAQFREIAPPVVVMLAVMLLLAGWAGWRNDAAAEAPAVAANPTELKVALLFAGLYGVVLLAVAAAKHWFGDSGLMVVAVLSGLTDMDAITLSTAQLARAGEVNPELAGRVILVAALANITFKAGVVWTLADRRLVWPVTRLFGVALLVGGLLVFFL